MYGEFSKTFSYHIIPPFNKVCYTLFFPMSLALIIDVQKIVSTVRDVRDGVMYCE